MKRFVMAMALSIVLLMTGAPALANEEDEATVSISEKMADQLDDVSLNKLMKTENEESEGFIVDSAQQILTIETEQDLFDFAASVNEKKISYKDCTVTLKNDLILTKEWRPIKYFEGTFEGGKHSISNLVITDAEQQPTRAYNGFFGVLGKNAQVQNLYFIDGKINACQNVGGIAAINFGEISESSFSGWLYADDLQELPDSSISGAGGIAGINFGNIDNCKTEGEFTRLGTYLGGIVGISSGNLTEKNTSVGIQSCNNSAKLYMKTTEEKVFSGGTGGIAGIHKPLIAKETAADISAHINDCFNMGDVFSDSAVTGGIIGLCVNGKIENCENDGDITQKESLWTGGITGSFNQTKMLKEDSKSIYIRNCINRGSIDGLSRVGGIAGGDEQYNNSFQGKSQSVMTIENCINTGDLTAAGYVGGISGYSCSTISGCYNMGNIRNVNPEYGFNASGGIVSRSYKPVADCFNLGNIDTQINILEDRYASGGIMGIMDRGAVITRCYSTGAIGGNHENNIQQDGNNTVYYGGIVGDGSSEGLTDCYFNTDTAGRAQRAIASKIGKMPEAGLRTWQMTGKRAETFMPELFEAKTFYVPENLTINGVVYSMTPQLQSLTPAYEMDPTKLSNGIFSFVTVTLPQGEGYTASAAEGYHAGYVALQSDFVFTVTLSEGHQKDTLTVKANGELLKPDENGLYTIRKVETNQEVSVALTAPEVQEDTSDKTEKTIVSGNTDQKNNPKTGEIIRETGMTLAGIALLIVCAAVVFRRYRKN